MDPVGTITWIVLFVIATVAVTGVVGRLGWSAPVALVIVGGAVSFIPGVPQVEVEPELILYGILPPLLFAAAIRTSVIDVRARRDSILLLSVGLVAFTVVTVGFAAFALIPSITLAAAFALAAVIAPTDAIAVTAIAGRLGLPRRVVTILEGESLLNDATALVALNASIAAIVSAVSPPEIGLDFVVAVLVGTGVGFLTGFVVSWVRSRLHSAVLDTSLTLVTPFAAFLLGQVLHGSGVLAVVIAGLYLGYRAPVVSSAEARVAERLNWRTIQFLLENAVFLFIGLNLKGILAGALSTGPGFWQTVVICIGILLALVASRFAWVMGTTLLYRKGPRRLRERALGMGQRRRSRVGGCARRGDARRGLPAAARDTDARVSAVPRVRRRRREPARRARAPGDHPAAEAAQAELRPGAHRAETAHGGGAAGGYRLPRRAAGLGRRAARRRHPANRCGLSGRDPRHVRARCLDPPARTQVPAAPGDARRRT